MEENLTIEEFMAVYPQLYGEIVAGARAEGYAEGFDKGKKEGFDSGCEAERQRIREVEERAIPGHETLVQEMKYDGKTTGPEAADRILAAEKKLRETKLESFKEEHTVIVSQPDPGDGSKGKADDEEGLPIEEKAKREWDGNKKLQQEFRLGGFQAYLAWLKNEQNVRIARK